MEDKIVSKILKSIELPSYIRELLVLNGFRTVSDLKLLNSDAIDSILKYVRDGGFSAEPGSQDPVYVVKCLGRLVTDFSTYSIPFLDKSKLLTKLPAAIATFESSIAAV